LLPELVIDLPGTLPSIDPALAYSPREWSVVHSIYDAPIGFAADGTLQPLAAERFEAIDAVTFEIALREGLVFHDGSPVTSAAIQRAVAFIQESASFAVDLFAVISRVEIVDELTARLVCATPAPWLPAQIAVWLVLVPEGFTPELAASAPVGTGPYRFESYEPGSSMTLVRNERYPIDSIKGSAMAERVTYRFVPEASTRVADLASGAARIVTDLPIDQLGAVEQAGGAVVEPPIVGSAWLRIATDMEPFDDPRVRLALNHAVDVQAIADALVSSQSRRLASLFPDSRSIAFNEALTPFAYDPDRARALLEEVGVADGFETALELTAGGRADVAEAIAAQLGEVGLRVRIEATDLATFNETWADSSRPPLRLATWSPLYDPHTLLSLVFESGGFLSRYGNPEADRLIGDAAVEADPAARAELYRELSRVMYDDPPALFLWNLASAYGVSPEAMAWTPRGDEYVIATVGGE
nr:ABC transporter substrate-binding protein [Chloroflexia bacterium]